MAAPFTSATVIALVGAVTVVVGSSAAVVALAPPVSAQPLCPSPGVLSGDSCTYTYTSVGPTEETLTATAGVNMTVTAYGAPGGRGEDNSGTLDGTPGGGGMEQGTFNFPIDEALTILVGEAGSQASAAGEGGGGAGDTAYFGELYQGGKGGGGSYVFADGSPLVIAGGGGGTGSDNSLGNQLGGAGGGASGGTAGQAGLTSTAPAPENQGGGGGNPGTSSGGGLGGTAGAPPAGGTAPQSGQNGKGRSPVPRTPTSPTAEAALTVSAAPVGAAASPVRATTSGWPVVAEAATPAVAVVATVPMAVAAPVVAEVATSRPPASWPTAPRPARAFGSPTPARWSSP